MNCAYCNEPIPQQKLKQSRVPVKFCSSKCQWRNYVKLKKLSTDSEQVKK